MPSLAEELPKEQARVRELLEQYQSIGPAGIFGATMMKAALGEAEKAAAAGDVVAMLHAYESLQSFEG